MGGNKMNRRKPIALSNWKMNMKIKDAQRYVDELRILVHQYTRSVDIIICPPYTALRSVYQVMNNTNFKLGAQNMAPTSDLARTGEISAELLVDAGCEYVLLGHWEVRRNLCENDLNVNRKIELALSMELKPIVLIGEEINNNLIQENAISQQLEVVLDRINGDVLKNFVFIYEPERSVGKDMPAQPEHVSMGCRSIRNWLESKFGNASCNETRIIYGGSVSAEYVEMLMASPDVDGLGVARKGRDVMSFSEIIKEISNKGSRIKK
jgi:triosephosphate isomerase (TIM)